MTAPHDLTWLCHVCGQERPDAAISVIQSDISLNLDGSLLQNVRFCNDNPDCTTRAPQVMLVNNRIPFNGRLIEAKSFMDYPPPDD